LALRLGREVVAAGEVVADPLRLQLGERHHRADRLQQPHEEHVVYPWMKHAPEQRQVVSRRRDQIRIEEREADLVARAVHDDVGVDLASVGEPHGALGQLRDVRLGRDLAVGDAREHVVGHRGMGLAEAMVGLGKAVALHVTHHQPEHRCLRAPAHRVRDARRGRHRVERPSEDVLGDDQAPRRAARWVWRATNDASTAMSMAELPMPSTTTDLPRNCSGSSPVYWCECNCSPANRSCPGNAGSGQRGSQ